MEGLLSMIPEPLGSLIAGANALVFGTVAILAGVLRWSKLVPRTWAIVLPTVLGSAFGVIFAAMTPDDARPMALAVLTAFLIDGAAATLVARATYPLLAKFLDATDDPPARE